MNLTELGCYSSARIHLVQDKPLGYQRVQQVSDLQKGILNHGIGRCRSDVLDHFHILNTG